MPAVRNTRAAVWQGGPAAQAVPRSASRSLSRSVSRTDLNPDSSLDGPEQSESNSSLEDTSVSLLSEARVVIRASDWLDSPALSPDSEELSPESPTPAQITVAVERELKALDSTRHSWAWKHFELVVIQQAKKALTMLLLKYKCQLNKRNSSDPCNSVIAPCGGTKSLIRHLQQVHRMTDPNPKPVKHSRLVHRVRVYFF